MSDHNGRWGRGLRQGALACLFMALFLGVGLTIVLPRYDYPPVRAWTGGFVAVVVTFGVVSALGAAGVIGPRDEDDPHRSNPLVLALAAVGILALLATECTGF